MADEAIKKEDDLFEEKPAAPVEKPVEKVIEPVVPDEEVTNLLSEMKNDDGTPKYKTVAEALKAAVHAQTHIKTLEEEQRALKDQGKASEKLDELLEAVKNSKGSGTGVTAPAIKPEEVLTIVKDYLDDTKAAEQRTTNIETVTNVFKNRYGKDASEKLYSKAKDLGFDSKEINSMIANNPQAALKVLGEAKTPSQSTDPLSKANKFAVPVKGGETAKSLSVMGPTSTKQLNDAWAASKQRTLQRLGVET